MPVWDQLKINREFLILAVHPQHGYVYVRPKQHTMGWKYLYCPFEIPHYDTKWPKTTVKKLYQEYSESMDLTRDITINQGKPTCTYKRDGTEVVDYTHWIWLLKLVDKHNLRDDGQPTLQGGIIVMAPYEKLEMGLLQIDKNPTNIIRHSHEFIDNKCFKYLPQDVSAVLQDPACVLTGGYYHVFKKGSPPYVAKQEYYKSQK